MQHGRDLAAAAAKVSGYNPTATDLTPAALTAAMKVLSDHNGTVAGFLIEAGNAIDQRSRIYGDEKTG